VRFVIRDALAVVDAAVQGEVDTEGQQAHGASLVALTASTTPANQAPR
jgi:hypothetical protein